MAHQNNLSYVENTRKKRNLLELTKRGPKKARVPKKKIVDIVDLLRNHVKIPTTVLGQWIFATHEGRNMYITKPPDDGMRRNGFWRILEWHGHKIHPTRK